MELVAKILIIVSVVGLLRCSARFRSMSSELDQRVYSAIQRLMHATESDGQPPQLVMLVILLSALSFMLSVYFTAAYGR